jgi:hypothetical protein
MRINHVDDAGHKQGNRLVARGRAGRVRHHLVPIKQDTNSLTIEPQRDLYRNVFETTQVVAHKIDLFIRLDQVKVGKWLETFEPNSNDQIGKIRLRYRIYVLYLRSEGGEEQPLTPQPPLPRKRREGEKTHDIGLVTR